MRLQALIFDVDGTLAETEEMHRAAFNAAFKHAGLDWKWDRRLYGRLLKIAGGKERIRYFITTYFRIAPSADLELLITDLHRKKTTIYADMIADGKLGLRVGVREVIEGARSQGLRLAIATTTSRPNVDALLRTTLGIDGTKYFEVIAAGDCVANKKPSPEIYLQVLKTLDLKGAACLAIEDTEIGLRAARMASIPTLVTVSRYSRGQDFEGAVAAVSALTDFAVPRSRKAPHSAGDLLTALRELHDKAGRRGLKALSGA
jgi:HAD superfamily hydrolase (TIGR01509 family)